jgi:gamma-glutamyltranspeptidase/glutathione hydrolase
MADGGFLEVESGFLPEVVRALDGRGHDVRVASYESFGGYQAISRRDGVYYGASEGRKDGQAAGW